MCLMFILPQSQFVYLSSAIHSRTARNFRAPRAGLPAAVFWGVNLTLLIVPHLFAWRCWKDSDNCGRTYTVDAVSYTHLTLPTKLSV